MYICHTYLIFGGCGIKKYCILAAIESQEKNDYECLEFMQSLFVLGLRRYFTNNLNTVSMTCPPS